MDTAGPRYSQPIISGSLIQRSTESRVVRTCGTGSWQHWFTPADEPILRPLLAAYMQAYGYDRDWSLSPTPTISAAHSTDYVLRIVNQKRAQEKLVPLDRKSVV